jgi:hypothetical protein
MINRYPSPERARRGEPTRLGAVADLPHFSTVASCFLFSHLGDAFKTACNSSAYTI